MTITSLYGMETPKQSKEQQDKLKAAIEFLGKKYILASSIKKNMTKE